jgi:hypothetical protein
LNKGGFLAYRNRQGVATRRVELDVPVHVTEALLAHTSDTISGYAAIYIHANLLTQTRDAVQCYEAHIASIAQRMRN